MDFGKSQDRFGRFSWSKNDSNYLDIKLKVFKREDRNAEFRLRQNFSMGEADFHQFIRQRNQLVVAADNFLREQYLPPVLQSTLCKDMEEQLKIFHKVIDVVDLPNRKICVTLLRYKADNPETSYAQVRLFGRKKEEEKFQQIVYFNYRLFKFGGLIGYGNSCLDSVFRYSKVFRLHAKLHDAAGAVRSQSGKGPGYCYIIGRGPNSCLLGHVTGLLFCLYVKLFLPSIFNSVDF